MLLKKLLLEFGTLIGFTGGGSAGIIHSSQKSIEINYEGESHQLNENSSTLITKQDINKVLRRKNGLISQLNHSILNSGRGQSEGVGQNFLFINGGDNSGKPVEISSKDHSQKKRELGGGRLIAFGNYDGGGFGPRDVTKIFKDLERARNMTKGKSYGPMIQETAKYFTQEDGEKLTQFGSNRSEDLEEDIFGLGKGREYWVKHFGVKNGKVDLEFQLDSLGRVLKASEDDLKEGGGKYGELVKNSFLDKVRYFGDLEGTAFNYVRKVAGSNDENTEKLKERNVLKIIGKLIAGEEMGFKCNQEHNLEIQKKYFEECDNGKKEKLKDFEIVSVLKSTVQSDNKYRVPKAGKGSTGKEQSALTEDEEKQLINFEKIEDSKLIYEKCEKTKYLFFLIPDPNTKIRQEACEQLLNPGFGDVVEDKRLCLFRSLDNNHLLRLINYIKVITIPSGHHQNTFGTKCSNFGI